MKLTLNLLALGTAVLLAASCSSSPEPPTGAVPTNLQERQAPDWVVKGSGGFFVDESERAFYGVGSINGLSREDLARMSAENRARAEIQKIFETYLASLMKDYTSSITAGDMSVSGEQHFIGSAMTTLSSAALGGVVITEYWSDPGGTVYALARLDLDAVEESFSKVDELSAAIRNYVQKYAARAFRELAAGEMSPR